MSSEHNLPEGKKQLGHFEQENILNLVWGLGLPLLVLPVAVILPNVLRHPVGAGIIALFLCLIGFVFFSVAKFSQFKQGRYLTFGSAEMSPRNRLFYRCGYALMMLSATIALCLIFAAKMPLRIG